MSCETKLLVGFPTVEVKSTEYGGETYEVNFFGGLVQTTAAESTATAWDETKTDYKMGDVVYIQDLKSEYLCGQDGNMEYPPATAYWDRRSSNDYRQIDDIPTTKTTSTTDIVNVYDCIYATHIVGHFIDGCDEIVIEAVENNYTTVTKELATITMTEVIDFECYSCCNPDPKKSRYFYLSLEEKSCNDRYIRVTFKKTPTASTIKIGTSVAVRAVSAGTPTFNTFIDIDNGIDFIRTKITKDIQSVNMGATVVLSGDSWISAADKKRLHEYKMDYQGLTFSIFDTRELKVIGGVVMGKFTTSRLQIGLNRDTKYQFKTQGVLA